jgi:hypothetical protein
MDDDTLQNNPFFQLFLSSRYYADAAKKKYIVCAPHHASLPKKVTLDVLESHILVPTRIKREFVTLNGKSVLLQGECFVLLCACA